jgi:hypothetical protein
MLLCNIVTLMRAKKSPTESQISAVMRALAQRPRRMSPAAIAQRRRAGKASGRARRRTAKTRHVPNQLAHFSEPEKRDSKQLAQKKDSIDKA